MTIPFWKHGFGTDESRNYDRAIERLITEILLES